MTIVFHITLKGCTTLGIREGRQSLLVQKTPVPAVPRHQTFWDPPPHWEGQAQIAYFLVVCIKKVQKFSGCAKHTCLFGITQGGSLEWAGTPLEVPKIKRQPVLVGVTWLLSTFFTSTTLLTTYVKKNQST